MGLNKWGQSKNTVLYFHSDPIFIILLHGYCRFSINQSTKSHLDFMALSQNSRSVWILEIKDWTFRLSPTKFDISKVLSKYVEKTEILISKSGAIFHG
jgi:hypothetical protein